MHLVPGLSPAGLVPNPQQVGSYDEDVYASAVTAFVSCITASLRRREEKSRILWRLTQRQAEAPPRAADLGGEK
jgi:hypothetical protein